MAQERTELVRLKFKKNVEFLVRVKWLNLK